MPPSIPDRPRKIVVAAVVRRDDGRFLLARRLPHSHLGGLWEFPGGSIEDGETPDEALRRELKEELGVGVSVGDPTTFAFHRDGERDVVVLFYAARVSEGAPSGLLGQEIGWFTPTELASLSTPPADSALIATLAADGGEARGSKQ